MAVLKSRLWMLGALVTMSCYSPDVRDCTLSCASDTDCVNGQVCGTLQLCAAPALAGQCAQVLAASDAGVGVDADDARDAGADAARARDAAEPIDAARAHDARELDASEPHDARPIDAHEDAPPIDAHVDAEVDAASPTDAAPPADAPVSVAIDVTLTGKGSVTLDGGTSTCTSTTTMTCTLSAPRGTPATLRAHAGGGATFAGWTGACSGTAVTCTFTPTAASTAVGATFG